jgi:HSP20 family protein
MALIRRDPFRALRRRDEVFEDFFRDMWGRGAEEVMEPPAEVAETDTEVTVKMVVPGVEKDQLRVTVDDDLLTVRGEIKKETEETKKSFYSQEIRYGAFQRSVGLPDDVEPGKATAQLKNGMLTVTMPKSKQPKAHQVQVAVG